MSDLLLPDLLKDFFGESWPLVRLETVEVDPHACAWRIILCASEKIPIAQEDLRARLLEAYPFLKDITITPRHPAVLSDLCEAQALMELVHRGAGDASPDYQWRYSPEGNVLVTAKGGEGKAFTKRLENEILHLTGINVQVCLQQPKTEEGEAIVGRMIRSLPVEIKDLNEESGTVVVEGTVFGKEYKVTRAVRQDQPLSILSFNITDYTSSITVKKFDLDTVVSELNGAIEDGMCLRVRGDCGMDKFRGENVITARDINRIPVPARCDNMLEKRVELHLHTQMSAMDATASIKDVIKTAAGFGHKAVAITDHGVVQAFPDAAAAAAKSKIKLILGVEAYMTAESVPITQGGSDLPLDTPCVVLDLETTGLDPNSCGIIEIAAARVENGEITDRYQTFVDPKTPIPAKIVHLTGITDGMVRGAPGEEEALRGFSVFLKKDVAVAHNASFDMGFLNTRGKLYGLTFPQVVVDTLMMARALFPTMRRHRLDTMCAKLGVVLDDHHRAINDAEATAQIFLKMLEMAREQFGCQDIAELNRSLSHSQGAANDYHTIILVQNKVGLKNLYRLVSDAHLKYYHGRPRMPKALIQEFREGLIIGSACEAGELFRAYLDGRDAEAEEIGKFYDYFEIQPDGNNMFLLRSGRLANLEALHDINRKIVALGEKQKKRVVATGDVHFINPQDEYFRRILQHGQGFADADNQPPLYFRTTAEMLDEFDYLGEEKAYEVVVSATNAVADMVENVDPLPPYALYAPKIEGAEEYIVKLSWDTARGIYGEQLPEIVEKRLNKELGSITKYGFAVLFYIAHKLVQKSLSDDYLVGSRGSVGSSFVATMTGITEVNPLPAHYVCPHCRHSDWDVDVDAYPIGPDLPDALCPVCGTPYIKDGFDIPFEVFLGFEGDKVPDIDLNFSGEYQPTMHRYTEELFGKENVFRAGTIGTVADRTAYGYVVHYLEEKGIAHTRAEVDRLVAGCAGVKRTTGQHPAGMIVVPKEYDIYDFTPIQHPADDKDSNIITTHFDFNSLHDRLVKLDILGHDDPTMLRMLKDLTGIDPRSVNITDPETMALFSSTQSLGVTPEQIGSKMGTFGVPEFGTKFVRGMLEDTLPTTMSELVRISGLSHGTDVWLGNAQDIIRSGTATLKEAVCTRDDIMNALLRYGVEPKMAFNTMESVRKGKGLTPAMEEAMREKNVPDWFIDSCKKIKYMFPKAHAVAYVTMGLRVAWYKVHRPREYYAAYYTVRADDFDAGLMLGEVDELKRNIAELEKLDDQKQKDKNKLTILEIVLEMRCRGIQFAGIDLYESAATRFEVMKDGRVRPPLNALPGLGDNAAQKIVDARAEGEFRSEEDLKKRAGISSAVIEVLRQFRCIDGMGKTDQVSLFDML